MGSQIVNLNYGLDKKYDECIFLTSHNAFSTEDEGMIYAQQKISIKEQLEMGVRALMLDIEYYQPDPRQFLPYEEGVYLVHGKWIASLPVSPPQLIIVLNEIKSFLSANQNAVITILFESRITTSQGKSALVDCFVKTKIKDMLFLADKEGVDSKGWPTLREMCKTGKRLVVFSDKRQPGDTNSLKTQAADGMPLTWHYMRETVYGDSSILPEGWLKEREESKDASTYGNSNRRLDIMNHFPTFSALRRKMYFFGDTSKFEEETYAIINQYHRIKQHIIDFWSKYKKIPNFIALDFINEKTKGDEQRHIGTVQEGIGPVVLIVDLSAKSCKENPLSGQEFVIENRKTKRILDDSDGAGLRTYSENSDPSLYDYQRWSLEYDESKQAYKIKSVKTNRVLDDSGGAGLRTYSENSDPSLYDHQRWYLSEKFASKDEQKASDDINNKKDEL